MERDGEKESARARVIRPAAGDGGASPYSLRAVEELAAAMVRKARARVAELERRADRLELEFGTRRRELEEAIAERERRAQEEHEARAGEAARRLAGERERVLAEAREEGRREGFRKGYEEGFQKGYDEGAAKGREEGREEGRRREAERYEAAFGEALGAARRLGEEFAARRERLLAEAREDLIRLAVDVARKVVKREVREVDEVVIANVRKALDLVARRHGAVIRIHPDDLAILDARGDEALGLFRERASFRIETAPEVGRGGCVVESGAGRVDMSVETQLETIEQALFEASAHADLRS